MSWRKSSLRAVTPCSSETTRRFGGTYHHYVSCLVYSSTLKMETVTSSEISVDMYQTTWNHIAEESHLHSYGCETSDPFSAYLPPGL
jgi:hypothetical protein